MSVARGLFFGKIKTSGLLLYRKYYNYYICLKRINPEKPRPFYKAAFIICSGIIMKIAAFNSKYNK